MVNMELVFCYIRRFRNFSKQSIRFTNQFKMDYNSQENMITIKENEKFIELENETPIISMNVIVGRNGVGKSNLLDLIGMRYHDRETLMVNKSRYIDVFKPNINTIKDLEAIDKNIEEKGELYFLIYYVRATNEFIIEGTMNPLCERLSKSEVKDWRLIGAKLEDDKLISKRIEDSQKNKVILLLREKFNEFYFDSRSLSEEDESRMTIQRRLAKFEPRMSSSVIIFLFEELKQPNRTMFKNQEYKCLLSFNDFHLEDYSTASFTQTSLPANTIGMNVLNAFITYYYKVNFNEPVEKEQEWKEFTNISEKYFNDMNKDNYAEKYWEIINEIGNKGSKKELFKFNKEGFREQYDRFVSAISNSTVFGYNSGEIDMDKGDAYLELIINQDSKINEYKELLDATIGAQRKADKNQTGNLFSGFFMSKLLSLSDGEEAFLDLFASIYEQLLNINNDTKHFIILLDEPEQRMHPELARRFIDLLRKYLKDIAQQRPSIESIQIITTTHSPFILTDFAASNIISLENKEQENLTDINIGRIDAFAGNIHKLLIDDFFMTSTIGEYASGKIREVIKWLKDESITKEEFKEKLPYYEAVIQNISEPIIKIKLDKALQKRKDENLYSKEINYDKLEELLQQQTEELLKLRQQLEKDIK